MKTHVSKRNSTIPSDGILVDGGSFAICVYPLINLFLKTELENQNECAVLTVDPYFHDAFLMSTNCFYVSILEYIRKDFPNLQIVVDPTIRLKSNTFYKVSKM